MMYIDEIRGVLDVLFNNKDIKTREWFEQFDKKCRTYIYEE